MNCDGGSNNGTAISLVPHQYHTKSLCPTHRQQLLPDSENRTMIKHASSPSMTCRSTLHVSRMYNAFKLLTSNSQKSVPLKPCKSLTSGSKKDTNNLIPSVSQCVYRYYRQSTAIGRRHPVINSASWSNKPIIHGDASDVSVPSSDNDSDSTYKAQHRWTEMCCEAKAERRGQRNGTQPENDTEQQTDESARNF